jgi:SWI/SNF-related matrix-associated actin-dependent regulator 1 of chromatin subfamily A
LFQALNSSDEEWCPAAKKQKTKSTSKSVSRRLSSSDDDEKPQARAAESDMSDGGVDDDYSEDERPNKRSAASEKPLLKFLNTATAAELAILKSFSDKKVELMIELRPFSSFLDIRKKIDAYKNELGAKVTRRKSRVN